jgi:hypothetical protein
MCFVKPYYIWLKEVYACVKILSRPWQVRVYLLEMIDCIGDALVDCVTLESQTGQCSS